MWRDVDGRMPVESFDDSTREGGREMAEMEHTGCGGRNPDYRMSFPTFVRRPTLSNMPTRVCLRTNVGKTVGMVCNPCQAAGNLTSEAYRRRFMGVGPRYR